VSIELTILFDGNSEALREHRLSVAELGKPLQLLLAALQRTASGIIRQATDDSYGEHGGRVAAAAKRLDIQIAAVADGCVQLHTALVQQPALGENLTIPGLDLPEAALVRLLEDLEAEASGQSRNAAARKYLRALPPTVTKQQYIARHGDVVVREVTLGQINALPAVATAPRISRVVGFVSAVGLETDHETITIKGDDGKQTFTGTAALVDRALSLRNVPVRATAVSDVPGATRARLLRLDATDADVAGTPDARLGYIADKWKDALALLAK